MEPDDKPKWLICSVIGFGFETSWPFKRIFDTGLLKCSSNTTLSSFPLNLMERIRVVSALGRFGLSRFGLGRFGQFWG